MKSSAELIQSTGAVISVEPRAGVVVAAGVEVVDEIVGVGLGDTAGKVGIDVLFGRERAWGKLSASAAGWNP